METWALLPPFEQVDLEASHGPSSLGEEEVLEGDRRVERERARVGACLGRTRRRVPVRESKDSVVGYRDKAEKEGL